MVASTTRSQVRVARWQFQPIRSRRNMQLYYTTKPKKSTLLFYSLGRILIVRKLLILKSLQHVGRDKMGISYHKFTVRLAESMIKKAKGANLAPQI